MNDFDKQLYEDIGYIKAEVSRIVGVEKRLLCVEKKMNRILGYAAGVGAMFGLMAVFIKETWRKLIGS